MGLATEGEEAAMPRGWEGNRRSGIALDMRHRLQRFIHLLSHGLRKGDEHPSYTSHGVWHTLPFLPRLTYEDRIQDDFRRLDSKRQKSSSGTQKQSRSRKYVARLRDNVLP